MLTELNIDKIHHDIQANGFAEIFYVADRVQCREGIIDESAYKSNKKFSIISIKITDIVNAYFEYLYYLEHMDEYHIEEEKVYYSPIEAYIHKYIVPNYTIHDSLEDFDLNGQTSEDDEIDPNRAMLSKLEAPLGYTKWSEHAGLFKPSIAKDINPRMPSIIYGYVKENIGTGAVVNIGSPVIPTYHNELVYGNTIYPKSVLSDIEADLEWKYKKLSSPFTTCGIDFDYVSSDWYCLQCSNFPRSEHILINVKDVSDYFMTVEDATSYIESQLDV